MPDQLTRPASAAVQTHARAYYEGLSTEELLAEFESLLYRTVAYYVAAAAIASVLHNRGEGERLRQVGKKFLNHLRRIDDGIMLPEVLVRFERATDRLITAIGGLPHEDQRRLCVEGETVPFAFVDEAGAITVKEFDPQRLDELYGSAGLHQVFAGDSIRPATDQKEMVRRRQARRLFPRREKVGDATLLPDGSGIKHRGGFISRGDIHTIKRELDRIIRDGPA